MVDSDRENYQTVYARCRSAVAAPTAGLHFTESLLQRIAARQVAICRLTLHVGLGTFRPIEAARLSQHVMHSEWGAIDAPTVAKLVECRREGGRIIAVGTTSVRLLESASANGEPGPLPVTPTCSSARPTGSRPSTP